MLKRARDRETRMEEARVIGQLLHCEGLTDVRVDEKRQIVCSGCDNTLFFYEDSVDGDSYMFDIDGVEAVTAVAPYRQGDQYLVAVATKEHTVVTYSYLPGNPNDDLQANSAAEGMLLRFTAPVTCVAVSCDSSWVAAGASDFQLKLASLSDLTKVSQLCGHEAPLLWVEFDQQAEYLASSSCDGSIRVWSVNTKEQLFVATVLQRCNDVCLATCLCRLAWQPGNKGQGLILAVPSGKEVKLFERGVGDWKCTGTLADNHHNKDVNVCCWSHCGRYLALGGADGHVTIWEHTNKQTTCIKKCKANDNITAMCWDPLGREKEFPLIFSTFSGKLCAFPCELVCPDDVSMLDDPLIDDSLLMEGIPPDDIFSMDDASIATPPPGASASCDGGRESEGENDTMPVVKRRRLNVSGSDEQSASRSVSPSEQTITEPISRPPPPPSFSDKLIEVYHDAVHPSATPTYLQHRFMVYNMVGAVRCHNESDSTSLVEVEFHSSTTHHSFSVSNHSNFNMAALSSSALVLASERNYDEPSILQVTHFSSWSSAKEWSMQLPGKENVEVIAIGDEWVSAATDKQFLRIFSISGIQRDVLSLPGRAVAMAGWRNQLAIVYQTPPCTDNVFSLQVLVLDVHNRRVVHRPHNLPLTPHTKLEWLGFSEAGLLLSYDTKGVVRSLSTSFQLMWQPILDCAKVLGKSKSDHYFIVGMTHNPAEMRVILCKGMDYPAVLPRPVMSSLSLQVPLCEPQTEKTDTENKFQQLLLHPPALPSSDSDLLRPLIQMLALACQSNQEYRAFEVASMMPTEQGLELALQYASKSGHHRLAREINELQQQKALQEEEEDEEDITVTGNGTDWNHSQSVSGHQNISVPHSNISTTSSRMKLLMAKRRQREKERAEMKLKSQEHINESEETEEHEEEISNELLTDQTKELFSDEEEEKDNEDEEEVRVSASPVILTNERYNPFKMATPQRKQVEANRRSSFLENIRKEAEKEEEKKKEKQQHKQKGTRGGKRKSDGGKEGPKSKPKSSAKATTQKLSAFSFTKK